MPGKITLTITTGSRAGTTFVFEEHDTLLLGRKDDCHISLPEDIRVSRHQLILEVNPPQACLRDLGSLHGTYVNGRKYGGREQHETPEEGSKQAHSQIDLHDGDSIAVGKTVFQVRVEEAGHLLEAVRCQYCGNAFEATAGLAGAEDYLCPGCRVLAQEDPGRYLFSSYQSAPEQTSTNIHIPAYQIIRKLGRGGMGTVYLAQHIQHGQQVALKVMLSRVAVDERSRQRFLREMEATRALRHPHIVPFIDGGTQNDFFYFLLKFCDGGDLIDLMELRGDRLSLREAGPILLQALEGLAFVHQRGFVHRDLKPQNILLSQQKDGWHACLSDLGLAKNFVDAGFSGMTTTSEGIGSYAFMPREQVTQFKYFQPVSDVWAMGATCYYALTGLFPRNHYEEQDQIKVALQEEAIPILARDPHLPVALARVIDRSLASAVSQRYQNAGEMYEALKLALA